MTLHNLRSKLFSDINSIPEVLQSSYFPSLDGLRAVAIVSVILRHLALYTSWGDWVDKTLGIQIFFIISGFLITTLLLKEKVRTGKVSLKNFYIRRILRIFPVAYLFIAVLIILNYIFKLDIPAKSFLTSVLYLKNFPIAGEWYTGHFWSLAVEEQFYLLVPILLVTNINRYIKLILLLFILVPMIGFLGFNNVGVFYSNRPTHVVTFIFLALLDQGTLYILLGSLFSILVFKNVLDPGRFKSNYFLSTFCFLAAVLIHFCEVLYISNIIFAVLMGFVIVINLNENNFLTSILSNRFFVKIGILSYSMYIWQQIFTLNQPWKGYFPYSDNVWLNMAALLLVAYCSYMFYERWFLKLKSRFEC